MRQIPAGKAEERNSQVPADRTIQSENKPDNQEQTIHLEDSFAPLEENVKQTPDNSQSEAREAAQPEELIRLQSEKIASLEAEVASMRNQLTLAEQRYWLFSAQLSSTTQQLDKINESIGGRMLRRFGGLKYQYLLPVYRMLGMPPYGKKLASQTQDDPDSHLSINSATDVKAYEEILVARDSNLYDVICFPIIDWDFRFQRPQQLMSQFAAAGHRVFYVSSHFHSSEKPYILKEKRPNVFEVSLRGIKQVVYADVMDDQARSVLFSSLDELRRDLMINGAAAFVQLPFWWPLASQSRDEFAWPIIYDCMDFHAGFSTNKRVMVDQELDLLTSSDLVVVTSNFLEAQARPHNSNLLLVCNACDYRHFAAAGEPKGERRVIGYYGAIEDWFDSDLVVELAKKRPDWDFVLVGSTFSADIKQLSKLSNVYLVGEKHYAEIPDWLGKFDVAIIPFRRTELTEATNPVKAFEILASGKPLVSVPIPEVASLAPLVRLAANADEFEREISAALAEDEPELQERRRAFAKQNTWEARIEALAPAVTEVFPRASIIVVTYNNLALNRLCLESVFARTEWPNFEVIVVDNKSEDGTPEYLLEAKEAFPNLKVILNDSNLGFAAANNIGLRQAIGDYLVLLNNDTIVTQGWLSTLIRHLNRDRRIGLIGPVTNNIGNEAKVDVDYTEVDDMPAWAARFVREHDRELFDIPMLAMFCLGFIKETFQQIGFLDEQFGIGMFEDDDYSHRVRQEGLRIVCAPDVFIHHFGQASFKKLVENGRYQRLFDENRDRYERKWNSKWVPHQYASPVVKRTKVPAVDKTNSNNKPPTQVQVPFKKKYRLFEGMPSHVGTCNVCGKDSRFFYSDKMLYRESLLCGECLTSSRYRSIARGILRAVREITGIEATSVAELSSAKHPATLSIYDAQVPYSRTTRAYPIPEFLSKCKWIRLETSLFQPGKQLGSRIRPRVTNQNLEELTFADSSFDIVITSDVLEHVRSDLKAHHEIRRVLRSGGAYVFTVPHFRNSNQTFHRVQVVDPADPSKDIFLTEKEYHNDPNAKGGKSLSYRSYGTDLDQTLEELGFSVEYEMVDIPENGILSTELFYCRLTK